MEFWAVLSIDYTFICTGYIITAVSDIPCHLWMRYSTVEPQKHIKPIMRRGAPVGSVIDQCFVAYHDNEQEEAGDTIIHTFIKEPWAYCETRWFYFRGRVAGSPTRSAGPIFKKHRDEHCIKIYPDIGSGRVTVDGNVWCARNNSTWFQLVTAAGTHADPAGWLNGIYIRSHTVADRWYVLYRYIATLAPQWALHFAEITYAAFYLWGTDIRDEFGCKPRLALTTSDPLQDNDLVPADYQRLGDEAISEAIEYDDLITGGWNVFPLTAAGRALIIPGEIMRIGLRDFKYDVPKVAPPWRSDKRTRCFFGGDNPFLPERRPYLLVHYKLKL